MLASASVAAGDHDTAIALARRRAGLDPFDESAHRELISLLAQAGDRGGALVAYQRLADRLGREARRGALGCDQGAGGRAAEP